MKTGREKRPKYGSRISYARIDAENATQWRIYRRSEINRRVFCESRTLCKEESRRFIANELRRIRARLRDAVDAYDLSLLGVTP